MKRYYISDVIGDGSEDNPYRAAAEVPGVNVTALIPTHPEGHPDYGKPSSPWCLCLVAADDHVRIRKLPGVDPLPDVTLDTRWGAADREKQDAAMAALSRRGIAQPSMDAGDGYRAFLRKLGRKLDPTFHEDAFDVRDR